jgi:aldose 1-epimerase
MMAAVTDEARPTAAGTADVVVLTAGDARAEVWPGHGFNCLSWSVAGRDVLYTAPDWTTNPVPTRSGIPILFPFPNRIRDGRYAWAGDTYRLPQNDSTKKNAIHGFTPRRPWRVTARGAGSDTAYVRGEFRGSVDAPDCARLWPADYVLAITLRLTLRTLRVEAEVTNPDAVPLPFGLGFHPYFRLGPGGAGTVMAEAAEKWELVESLPTGRRLPLEPALDLRTPKESASLVLDDVYTGLGGAPAAGGLVVRGRVTWPGGETLEVRTSPDYRELVMFTPPHRQAVCLEPYTCTTDAINLEQQGVDAGWRVLDPGQSWRGVVELAAG